jgi:hypothetical protein
MYICRQKSEDQSAFQTDYNRSNDRGKERVDARYVKFQFLQKQCTQSFNALEHRHTALLQHNLSMQFRLLT